MNDAQLRDLIERVENFEFDEATPALTFADRLARENGWSVAYAERVAREYKRFAILAIVAGHPVTPSEDVDQAWHLHLTYTRSYWDRFCQATLRSPLHHNPTEGGVTEHAKFFEWYTNTLSTYQQIWHERPPNDIWPSPTQRFARAGAGRWIDPSAYWLIPRLRVHPLRWRPYALSLVLLVVAILGCRPQGIGALNPLDFTGSEFLIFYAAMMTIGIVASMCCRRWLPLDRNDTLGESSEPRDPYLAAALAHGPRGVVHTAIATLFSRGHLKLVETSETAFFGLRVKTRRQLVRGEPLPQDASELERVVFAAADDGADPQDIVNAGLPLGEFYCDRLREIGLVEDDSLRQSSYRTIPGLILGVILILGLCKLAVGFARVKPVGFLVILLTVTAVLVVYFLFSRRHCTVSGRRTLGELLKRHRHLDSPNLYSVGAATTDFALATALFGAIVWRDQDGDIANLYMMMRHHNALGGAGHVGGGGCGGGCGGGGGGGCGGCGGG